MIDELDKLGASLIIIALQLAMIGLPLAISVKTTDAIFRYRAETRWSLVVGLTLFIASLALVATMIYPSIQSLERHACKGSADFGECMGYDD